MCSVGGEGFYLLYRFHVTGEMEDGNRPNFSDNSDWFDIKVLTTTVNNEHKKAIHTRTYTQHISKILKSLDMPSNKQLHWGRSHAPLALELERVDAETIRQLGNWDRNTQERFYSSKLPLDGIHVMGGFGKHEVYHLPRARVIPSPELQQHIWPWIESEIERCRDAERNGPNKGTQRITALAVLNSWRELRKIILQDAAAMMIEYPERESHPLFQLPVFQTSAFVASSSLSSSPAFFGVELELH